MTATESYKTLYLQGRPHAHYSHANFAQCVGSDVEYIDFKMQWQDTNKGFLYRTVSWLVCAASYPNKEKYDFFLIDNLHFPPVIMKLFFLRRKKQKIIVYLGSHTLYFMYSKRFSTLNLWLHKWALRNYDAIICEGKMAESFTKSLLGSNHPPIYTNFNGIPNNQNLGNIEKTPLLEEKEIVFIGAADSNFRFFYKGISEMIEAFGIAFESDNALKLTLVGPRKEDLYLNAISKLSPKAQNAIRLVDFTEKLETPIFNASLYLHCANGDAFPTTVIIALSAGLPSLVSEITGAKEAVEQVSEHLVVKQNPTHIAEKINWYFDLTPEQRLRFSVQSRKVAEQYTEDKAISKFKSIFAQLSKDLFALSER